MDKFNDKFDKDDTHHSFCLSSDGCFKRHDIPRKDQYLTSEESRRADLNTFSWAESGERRLIAKVAFLQKLGCQLKFNETLEAYVQRHASRFDDEN